SEPSTMNGISLAEYLHLQPEAELPVVFKLQPFKAVLVIEELVSPEWQARVSAWLIESGCLYMMAWGRDCRSWDHSVDFAKMEAFDFQEIPEERFVLTTWHEHEPLSEVFWFLRSEERRVGK